MKKALVFPALMVGATACLVLVASGDKGPGGASVGSVQAAPPAPDARPDVENLGGVSDVIASGTFPVVAERYQGRTARWWAKRAVQARKDANARKRTIRRLQVAQRRTSAHFFDWLAAADCIRRHEGSWEDPNAPYYGGMQADLSFQRAYAPEHLARWGTADNWPWWAQLEMAYRGWLFRGWQPWPATSRLCGLR